ncbi:LCP family protein [Aestuariimicrobium ganziense]|uniref:LCP family protein n=1 Tax=Aestuariimicrobium ganziense TaxID=2773677 RepID=UPI00194426BF|nr:LCP family protein [Aestuariimicrobium ganziense]
MNDAPRRAGPPGEDDYLDSVFREPPEGTRAPRYLADGNAAADDPDATAVRPRFALGDDERTTRTAASGASTPTKPTPAAEAPDEMETSAIRRMFLGDRSANAPTRAEVEDDEPLFDRNHPFTRSLIKTAASTLVPGIGLVRSSSAARIVGWVAAGTFVASLLGLGIWVASDPVQASTTAVKPTVLQGASTALIVLGLIWVTLIVGTHLVTRPVRRNRTQRAVGALAVGVLSFAVAAPLAVASHYSSQQAGLVKDIFASQDDKKSQTRPTIETKGKKAEDVWAAKPRLNILLVGLDNTAVRDYDEVDISTDTMMVASIDTATGNTVIIQIPRNMARMQFPKGTELNRLYPQGWYDGVDGDNAAYFANSVWAHVPASHPDLFANTDYKGADALKLGMEGTLGLKIDYFMALNIDGLVQLIDAMGGVRINVNQEIPITDRYDRIVGKIDPGPNRLLNGYYAMWYARARKYMDGGDFSRMSRQTCVIKGVIDQADPATMLTRYEAIARASKQMISTDMPQEVLPAMVELARRVKNGKQTRVLFVHDKDGFVTYNPDFAMMRARVKRAIETVGDAPGGAPATKAPTSSASSSPGTSAGPSSAPPSRSSAPGKSATPGATPTVEAESLTDACAYNPVSPSPTPGR